MVAQEKIADVVGDAFGCLEQDGVLESVQDDERGVRKRIGDEAIEPRVASAVQRSGRQLDRK